MSLGRIRTGRRPHRGQILADIWQSLPRPVEPKARERLQVNLLSTKGSYRGRTASLLSPHSVFDGRSSACLYARSQVALDSGQIMFENSTFRKRACDFAQVVTHGTCIQAFATHRGCICFFLNTYELNIAAEESWQGVIYANEGQLHRAQTCVFPAHDPQSGCLLRT
jgi:hypothetical protein